MSTVPETLMKSVTAMLLPLLEVPERVSDPERTASESEFSVSSNSMGATIVT